MRKIVLLSLICLLFISTNIYGPYYADTLEELEEEKSSVDEMKNRIQANINQNTIEFENNKSALDAYLSEIGSINENLSEINASIVPLEAEISIIANEVEALYNTIIGLEGRFAERDRVLRERVRSIQANGGSMNYLDVLLGAKSFIDFIDRFSAVSSLLEADRNIMKKQAEEQEEIEIKKNDIDKYLLDLKSKKYELDLLKSSYASLIKDKEALIVLLEEEQERIDRRLQRLSTEFAEAESISAELETRIIAEQQKQFSIALQGLNSQYCTPNGELNLKAFQNKLNESGRFAGTASTFIDYADRYNIDPVLMAAIALHETGGGTSNGLLLYNNPGGLMEASSNWSSLVKFSTLTDGIESLAKTLHRIIHSEGRTSIQDIGQVYAPIGANNDPTGLNEHWVPNVTKIVGSLGGLTRNCENANQFVLSISDGTWISPAPGLLSSHFGWRTHPIEKVKKQHRGLDISNVEGTPVVAAGEGIVTKAGDGGGYGNVVMVMHVVNDQVYTTVYAHLAHVNVHEGQRVWKGQLIGQMGSTGLSTGSHLHFEFHEGYYSLNGPSAVNPLRYLDFDIPNSR